jgi:hypothetical protein
VNPIELGFFFKFGQISHAARFCASRPSSANPNQSTHDSELFDCVGRFTVSDREGRLDCAAQAQMRSEPTMKWLEGSIHTHHNERVPRL